MSSQNMTDVCVVLHKNTLVTFIENIGKGGYGDVYKVLLQPMDSISAIGIELSTKEAPKEAALKSISSGNHGLRSLIELAIMKSISYPYITYSHNIDIDPKGNVYIISQLAEGALGPLIRKYDCVPDPTTMKRWAWCLICAVAHLHSNGLIHGDIKGANVLVYTPKPVLTAPTSPIVCVRDKLATDESNTCITKSVPIMIPHPRTALGIPRAKRPNLKLGYNMVLPEIHPVTNSNYMSGVNSNAATSDVKLNFMTGSASKYVPTKPGLITGIKSDSHIRHTTVAAEAANMAAAITSSVPPSFNVKASASTKTIDWSSSYIRLNDFSLSIPVMDPREGLKTETVYTSTHRPMEIWKGMKWSFHSDIWALGCTFYELAYGAHLFPDQRNNSEVDANINVQEEWAKCDISPSNAGRGDLLFESNNRSLGLPRCRDEILMPSGFAFPPIKNCNLDTSDNTKPPVQVRFRDDTLPPGGSPFPPIKTVGHKVSDDTTVSTNTVCETVPTKSLKNTDTPTGLHKSLVQHRERTFGSNSRGDKRVPPNILNTSSKGVPKDVDHEKLNTRLSMIIGDSVPSMPRLSRSAPNCAMVPSPRAYKSVKLNSKWENKEMRLLNDMILSMTNIDAANRPTIYELVNHPYFDDIRDERDLPPPHRYGFPILRKTCLPSDSRLFTKYTQNYDVICLASTYYNQYATSTSTINDKSIITCVLIATKIICRCVPDTLNVWINDEILMTERSICQYLKYKLLPTINDDDSSN
jgi:serine/threonine protein kinase